MRVRLYVSTCISFLCTGVLILVGVIVVAVVVRKEYREISLHYSFGLCTAAGSLAVILWIVITAAATKILNTPPQPQQQQLQIVGIPVVNQPQTPVVLQMASLQTVPYPPPPYENVTQKTSGQSHALPLYS